MAARIASVYDAQRLLQNYERGIFTRLEAVSLLIGAAASCPVAELAEVLPAQWLDEIRKKTASPPEYPSDVISISGGLPFERGVDHDAHAAEMRQRWFDGAHSWHAYFA